MCRPARVAAGLVYLHVAFSVRGHVPVHGVRRRQLTPTPVRSCGTCHDSPHSEALLGAIAANEDDTCQACHDPSDPSFDTPAAQLDPTGHVLPVCRLRRGPLPGFHRDVSWQCIHSSN